MPSTNMTKLLRRIVTRTANQLVTLPRVNPTTRNVEIVAEILATKIALLKVRPADLATN